MKTSIHTFFVSLALVSMPTLSGVALAGDVVKGKAKAEAVCAACHGKDGVTAVDPSYPKLAGQHRDFLERALLDYQRGARTNAIMSGQAKPLTRNEIKDLSAYYASLPGPLTLKKPQ